MNLKPYYDAAVASVAEKQRIVQEMDALFVSGKKEEAVAMQPALEAAVAKAKADNELYNSMLFASNDSDTPQNFVPAGGKTEQTDQPEGAKKLGRTAFDALKPSERMKFIKSGGTVED